MSRNLYNPAHISDWLSRTTIPELYPRKDDPFAPSVSIIPDHPEMTAGVPPAVPDIYQENITPSGARPQSVQRAVNTIVTATIPPVPLIANTFYCDTMILDVYSTALNSVFFGFGSNISTSVGIEIRPGLPIAIQPDNTREMWELQRTLELIAGIMARQYGVPDLGTYRAPRVVFDASDWFVAAAAPTTVNVMLFYLPQDQ